RQITTHQHSGRERSQVQRLRSIVVWACMVSTSGRLREKRREPDASRGLLGGGEMNDDLKVIANGVELPAGVAGKDMTSTGWYNVVSLGARNGGFNQDFLTPAGTPAGDPYGSMAILSVVIPNRISDGTPLPRIDVLAEGLK